MVEWQVNLRYGGNILHIEALACRNCLSNKIYSYVILYHKMECPYMLLTFVAVLQLVEAGVPRENIKSGV
jgi:hypothetical protein